MDKLLHNLISGFKEDRVEKDTLFLNAEGTFPKVVVFFQRDGKFQEYRIIKSRNNKFQLSK